MPQRGKIKTCGFSSILFWQTYPSPKAIPIQTPNMRHPHLHNTMKRAIFFLFAAMLTPCKPERATHTDTDTQTHMQTTLAMAHALAQAPM